MIKMIVPTLPVSFFGCSDSAGSSGSAGFSFPMQPFKSFLQTGQPVLTFPASHFSLQVQNSPAQITIELT